MNTGRPAPLADRLLCGLLLLGVCLWMVRAHWENVDLEWEAEKVLLHEKVLANDAADPYQYKLWPISLALQGAADVTGASVSRVVYANTLFSLLFLLVLHHAWLRTYVGAFAATVGGIALGALGNVLFLTYAHHPHEFWGVGLFCLLLRGVERDGAWWKLALICLATGLVWEKHALVPVLWGLLQLRRGRAFLPSLAKGLVMLVAALAVPLLVRWHLGGDRAAQDGMTALHLQEWSKVLWFQLPYLLPFLAIVVLRARDMPGWVRLLWLYLPVLVVAYATQQFILHEVRSFWALAPVFTATLACWVTAALGRTDGREDAHASS